MEKELLELENSYMLKKEMGRKSGEDTTAIDNFIANRQFDKAEKELVNFLKQTSKTNEHVFLVVDNCSKLSRTARIFNRLFLT